MRILIAVRQHEMRAALRLLLSQEPNIRVVGEPGNSGELLASLEAARPDVVLVDCDLPGLATTDLLAQLHACAPKLKVLILCSKTERERPVVGAGVHAFIDTTASPRQLLTSLHILHLDGEYEQ